MKEDRDFSAVTTSSFYLAALPSSGMLSTWSVHVENIISCIQLFRERLAEKVHATMPKGIVGSTEFTVLQRHLKEWHDRPCKYV